MPDQVEVRLPELADAMASATLTAWLKEPGDAVRAGEPIAEVETDKTTVELEAPADGVLADVRVAAGAESVAVGAVLAVVRTRAPGDSGAPEDPPETAAAGAGFPEPGVSGDGGAAGERVEAPPPTAPGHSGDGGAAGDRAAARIERGFPEPGSSGDGGAVVDRAEAGPPPTAPGHSGDGGAASPARASAQEGAGKPAASALRVEAATPEAPSSVDVPATPLARRMAELAGLDLAAVAGSGDGGRVMKVDVELALRSSAEGVAAAGAPDPAPAAPAPLPVAPTDLPHADRPLTAMRRVTARRTAEAKRSAPHFYLEIECAADGLPAPRGAAGPGGESGAPTVNDVVVRAAALALRQVPLANSAWTGDAVRVYGRVDLAVAVATPAGLVTPVIRGADARTLAEISAELRRLAADARAGRLRPADYQGGTCTISNLGMYGVSSLYAILNPPQSCILGVGAVRERPVVRGGAVTVGSTMTVTLSADHRAIDGATGAELLRAFKTLIEDPGNSR